MPASRPHALVMWLRAARRCLGLSVLWLLLWPAISQAIMAKRPPPKAEPPTELSTRVMTPVPTPAAAPTGPSSQRVWTHKVPDAATWTQLARAQNGEEYSKFVIDVRTGDIYFVDAHVFPLHVDFVLDYLQKKPRTRDNLLAYNRNYQRLKPHFILGYLTHYPQSEDWVFSFWEGDAISASQIAEVRQKLQTSFFVQNLAFRPDSPKQEIEAQALRRLGVPVLSNHKLYQRKTYQALHAGVAIGRLVVVPIGTPAEDMQFARHDIVLLQESYPDISPVAGIITTHFSTPLSHVNLRATAWGIPNAGDKKAYARYARWAGQIVRLEVQPAAMSLRLASPAEQQQWQSQRLHVAQLPPADLQETRWPLLTDPVANHATAYGSKSANLARIASAPNNSVPIPIGFALPLSLYQQHLQQHGLDRQVQAMINDPAWRNDALDPQWQHRSQQLQSLRLAIQAAPLDASVLQQLQTRIRQHMGGAGVFVRSSTNAEDLAGFNGAGLYDTVPNVKDPAALEAAVKKVWASLWNLRAVQERHAFGLDDHAVYAGVLIQQGVNATAAGVLVSTDIYTQQPDTYTINAKWGLGMRVVEGQKIPEQILYDRSNHGTRILSRSDEPTMLTFDAQGGVKEIAVPAQTGILTEARARRLGDLVQQILPLFPAAGPCHTLARPNWSGYTRKPVRPNACADRAPMVLDIEWVLEGEQFWIVQARPYVQAPSPMPPTPPKDTP